MLAVALAFGVSAFKNSKDNSNKTALTDYYYQFTGQHGQENDMSKWVKLPAATDYDDLDCDPGEDNSCKIINTTNSGNNPTTVPLDGNGFPQQGSVNKEVILKRVTN